jgi:erythromycin esterase
MVGAATVVGLGEATHGSREFFQLKHRVLEYLVERKGFTVFAIEASYPESLAVNDYVLHGTGDPQKALAGMYFWTWNVQEVLAQIDWMRQWNADPKHAKKVKFIGFDMQTACVGVARALEYVDKVDPAAAKTARTSLAPLSCENEQKYRRLPAEQHTATAKALVDLLDLFDRRKPAWSARTSQAAWAIARQHAAVASQAEHQESGAGLDWRDESMAKNVRWILDNEPRGTRMVVWAHNGHVGVQGSEPWVPMGAHLSKQLGKAYLPVGFVFDHGAFQAMNGAYRLGEQHVGQAPAGDLAEAFHRVQTPIFALDLRLPPAGIVADWLNAPHSMREVGAMFSNEESTTSTVILPRRFDAVIYVDETTRARPL